jgi:hypothetical protein
VRRPRRTERYYRADCNGGNDQKGCLYVYPDTRDGLAVNDGAKHHAREKQHETVVTLINAMTVYDGRES